MAVYSMTGFATATRQGAQSTPGAAISEGAPGRHGGAARPEVTVDLRSVNGRFLDLSLRLPDDMRALEPALRELVATVIRRGKVELRLSTPRDSDNTWPQPQTEQLMRLGQLQSTVTAWLPNSPALSVNEVLNWCRHGGTGARLDDLALAVAREAVTGLAEARAREGERLVQVLRERLDQLRLLAAQAAPLLPAVVQRQQQRFMERWQQALAQGAQAGGASAPAISAEALQERALNEAAAFALRIDVAEELSRLNAHLDEISRLLDKGGELGKRLDFLIQELHREANTLGAKSAALELTNISVDMKVAIEQMREQVQNIE